MERYHVWYVAGWASYLGVCAGLLVRHRREAALLSASYCAFLFTPWKLASALAAMTGMALIGPYTGDPTWDLVTVGMMSSLTFLTAPWAVGTLARAARRRARAWEVALALGLALLSASWCYDAYLWARDGEYPAVWLDNLRASLIIYAFAGILWNLGWREGRGVHLCFTEPEWPCPPQSRAFRKLAWAAAALMALVAGLFMLFLRS